MPVIYKIGLREVFTVKYVRFLVFCWPTPRANFFQLVAPPQILYCIIKIIGSP
jgi:hypothetical protein